MNTTIHTPTNKIENSIEFYQKLGFKQIPGHQNIFTDGIAIIEINAQRYARAGIKLYKQSWNDEVAALSQITKLTRYETGHLLSDANGVWIYLEESEKSIEVTPTEQSFSTLGNFAGLSLETSDMSRSANLYDILGFKNVGGSPEHGYISLSNQELTISLMKPLSCPHLFFNPSMTYFNGKVNNPVIIEKIRALNIPITEEITHFNKDGIVDNIIIRDPGGYGFFIFND